MLPSTRPHLLIVSLCRPNIFKPSQAPSSILRIYLKKKKKKDTYNHSPKEVEAVEAGRSQRLAGQPAYPIS
jgi:hypothetical protein